MYMYLTYRRRKLAAQQPVRALEGYTTQPSANVHTWKTATDSYDDDIEGELSDSASGGLFPSLVSG